ncbi:fructosamine kinase family protein [Mucilaginibacter sp. KACC 22063]|uniref:fructosamine kinase family protein n=1 Tax=Mucilaginibacter sp. KACC 22063 TaxID=3025666 RepID=UPI002366BD1C|nr:fructosamine kinase family protein [Mucilaginibacter sp. KACC 22063]WDF53465.1 fructosamine kinase family protein [Mucilaginibacter sp. KACC 22063]
MAPMQAVLTDIENKLSVVLKDNVKINSTTAVSGGSINQAYCLGTNQGKLMLKQNSKAAYPDMFACEALGLETIGDTRTIAVPQVILQSDFEDKSYLVMEWIESRRATEKGAERLGRKLARMHKHSHSAFGFNSDNYMGSMRQFNQKHETWSAFFVEQRLQPMVKAAIDKNKLNLTDLKNFELLYQKLNNLFDQEAPSLIHGDLWSGNYLIATNETPYLIDPAVSYGNREFDIAMTTLFGGFSPRFYEAYQETFPLNADWRQRIDLWNLYPLLLHLNLFGLSYLGQVRDALESYI